MVKHFTEEEQEEMFQETMKFINAAIDAVKEGEYQAKFICPLCGGEAMVIKSETNGHHMANCKKCDMNFME